MSWDHGYVTEIQYTHGFYRELTPALLEFVGLVTGVRPALADGRRTYCELGCGQGFSTNLLAAANPDIDFHANDFNPGQVAGARRLASEAGLANVRFHERSFADMADEPSLPDSFDIIALHGIYSWISVENRRHILDFVRDRLKPGGLVYVSYNTLPGWSAAMPLRRLLVDRGAKIAGSITAKLDGALAFIERLNAVEGVYFKQNPAIPPRIEKLKTSPRAYLAHEFMNSDWAPEYFADVAEQFRGAKTEYLGSAHILDMIEGFNTTPDMDKLLAEESDVLARETLRDFMINQEFRRDVFVKGRETYPASNLRDAWGSARLALSSPRKSVPLKVAARRGEIGLREDVYNPLLDAFADGPKTAGELMARPELSAIGWTKIRQALLVLVGLGNLQPCLPADKDKQRARTTRAFNAAVMKRAEDSGDLAALASPVTGGGIAADRFTQLFASAVQQNRSNPVEWIWGLLDVQGQRLLKDGKPLEGKEANIKELEERAQAFHDDRLPVMRQLGIV